MSKIALGLLRELHWALVPIFIPVGPARIRWTLGLTLAGLAYCTWTGNPGLSELPGIAIFAYTAFLTGHLYETVEIPQGVRAPPRRRGFGGGREGATGGQEGGFPR
ncbi:hypothetical protein [Thermus scotoductus]|nr:hypothetical protein [Thermus scotoductus]RTG92836.1 hypothetical protein CSW51_10390 [Thermus scotoductus]